MVFAKQTGHPVKEKPRLHEKFHLKICFSDPLYFLHNLQSLLRSKLERERREHSRDLQRVSTELEKQKASLEASLKAARTEADCLREQLKNAEVVSQSRRTLTEVNARSVIGGGGRLEVNARSASAMGTVRSGLDDGSAPPPTSANALLKVRGGSQGRLPEFTITRNQSKIPKGTHMY